MIQHNFQKAPYGGRSRAPRQYLATLPRQALVIAALVLGLRLASSATANASFFVLAAYAMTGRAQAIQALFLSWLISIINPGLAPEASLAAVGRYAVIAGAMISVLLHRSSARGKFKNSSPVQATLLLGLFLIIHSLFVSSIPDVSILKSVSFIVVFSTLLAAWAGLNPLQRAQTEMFIFGGMIAIMLASLPFAAIPAVGYLRNGTGFQGILSHPQAFGPSAALFGAWLVGRFLSQRKLPIWQMGLLLLAPVLIMASEARTAGGALALGTALPLVWLALFRPHRLKPLLPGLFTGRFIMVFWAAIIGLLAFSVVIFAQLDHYFLKSGRSTGTDLSSALEASRGGLVERMMGNIRENPIGGIGFGIGSYPEEMIVKREPFTGLPIGASIEKGVLPVAVVEELGIPGAIILFGWLAMLIRRSSRAGFTSVVVLVTALMANLGEYMFFSVGGQGMLLMVLASWAATPRKNTSHLEIPLWIR